MACNNTLTPEDTKIVKKSTVPLSHPTSHARSSQAKSSELEKRVMELYPEYQTVQKVREALLIDKSTEHRRWFQNIGEMYATKSWAAQRLGVEQVGFVQAYHGLDHVGIKKDGRLAVFETKCFGVDPPQDAGLDQLARDKVERQLGLMMKEGGSQAKGHNPEIAAFAQEEGYVRYLVHVSYGSEKAWVYSVVDGPDGKPVRGPLLHQGEAKEFMGGAYQLYVAGPQGERE